MAVYFSLRIESGKLNYATVVNKFPQFKADIDAILIADGFQDLISV